MHGRYDDDHLSHSNSEGLHVPKPGHNRRDDSGVAQWQTPHIKDYSHTTRANPDSLSSGLWPLLPIRRAFCESHRYRSRLGHQMVAGSYSFASRLKALPTWEA